MNDTLHTLMEAGSLPPLSYYFARFVARGCGLGPDSLLAHSAALASMRNLRGDVCVDLKRYAGNALFGKGEDASGDTTLDVVPKGPALNDWLKTLREADWVGTPYREAPLILDGRRLYLGKYWRFEQQVANALLARTKPVENLDAPRLAKGLDRLFSSKEGMVDWQRVAAAIAVSRRFTVISGGPGTGKTTTVVKVLALLLEQNPRLHIALAAPTGKAATRLADSIRNGREKIEIDARLRERIPMEAGTIHRLLGARGGNAFKHDRDNPLALDCLVVDEASMIDLPLMARLLEALPEEARIILLGDRDQLASVEAGSVLGDITGHGREIRYTAAQVEFLERVGAMRTEDKDMSTPGSESPPCADAVGLLRVSYRFKEGSGIATLARTVNAGQENDALELVERRGFRHPVWEGKVQANWGPDAWDRYKREGFGDIAWLEAKPERLNPACIDWAVERYTDYLQEEEVSEALSVFERSRMLAALRRGPFGVEEINRSIEARLQSLGLVQGGNEYHGKPVMVTVNDYEVGLFNGDIGLLWRDEENRLRAYFKLAEDQVRSVSVRQLPEHDSAYALTVHKSQGSEFDEVMLVLPFDESPVVTRELIYTGITRARERVTVQGGRDSFRQGCCHRVERTSALAEKLGW